MNSEFTIAVHSLVFLANLPSRMASSELLASSICTNPVRIRKVMNLLKNQGLVEVQKGTGGGYLFQSDPASISLGQLYRIICDKSLASDWRSGDPEMDCKVGSKIGEIMSRIYANAEKEYIRSLDQVTIQDILNKLSQ